MKVIREDARPENYPPNSLDLTKDEDGEKWFLAWVSPTMRVRFLSPAEIQSLLEVKPE